MSIVGVTELYYVLTVNESHSHDVCRLAPNYDQALNNLGNLYKEQGNFSLAEEYLRKALSVRYMFRHLKWFIYPPPLSDFFFKEFQCPQIKVHQLQINSV